MQSQGVSIHAFGKIPEHRLLRLDTGIAGFFLEGKEGERRSAALLVLNSGGGAWGPGDVLLWPSSLPLEEFSESSPRPSHHIRRDDLSGRGVPGITGLRLRHAGGGIAVLRFGPPPGARWTFTGLRAFAVFAGKLTVMEGDEARDVPVGSLALVAEPAAALYLQAGNDSALAVALAAEGVTPALG